MCPSKYLCQVYMCPSKYIYAKICIYMCGIGLAYVGVALLDVHICVCGCVHDGIGKMDVLVKNSENSGGKNSLVCSLLDTTFWWFVFLGWIRENASYMQCIVYV